MVGTFDGVTNPIFMVNVPTSPGVIDLEIEITEDRSAVWVFNNGTMSSMTHSQPQTIVPLVINALNAKYQMPDGYGPLNDSGTAASAQSWIDIPSPIEV